VPNRQKHDAQVASPLSMVPVATIRVLYHLVAMASRLEAGFDWES
jgi:hypothetical protein